LGNNWFTLGFSLGFNFLELWDFGFTRLMKCKICQREFEPIRSTAVLCSPECQAQNHRNHTYKLGTRKKPRDRKTIYSGPYSPKRDLIRYYDLLYLNLDDSELGIYTDRQIRETAKYFWLSREIRLIDFGINKCERTIKK
jgi:hypothetical protein